MPTLRSNSRKKTFDQKLPLLLAFVLPILIMIGIFAGKGLYPFGENCFLRTDLYHQYVAFFENLGERMRAGKSLTYAFDIGLGTNYTALFAYYLCSPLHFLTVLIPASFVIEWITFLIVLKIGLCGLSMAWMLSKKYNTRHYGIAFCGICYALSGYMAAYSWNIMWLDVLWLAPLVILALDKLIDENRPFPYVILLGAAILCNYYISIMLCIFLVLYFITRMASRGRMTVPQVLLKIFNFGLFSLLAGGLAAVLLIPCAYALQITASANTTFPQTVSNYFSFFEMLSRHLITVETETGLDHWPNLYSGVGVFLFLPFYYMNKEVSYKEKIAYTVLLGVMLLGFNTNMLNYIWHGFHYPNSLPARQSYLYTLILLCMCFRGMLAMPKLTRGKLTGTVWGSIGTILLIEVIADKKEIAWYACYISIVFIGLYALTIYLHFTNRLKRLGAVTMATILLVIEMAINTAVTSVSYVDREYFVQYDQSYDRLIEQAVGDSPFTRIERSSIRTKNDGPYFGYNSASIFSSTTNANISHLYTKLGMEGNINAYSFNGSTVLTASMLSVGYRIAEAQWPESPLYTLVATDTSTLGYKSYLYKYNYTLPLGFLVPDDTNEFWDMNIGTPAKVQNSFVNIAANTGNVLETVTGTKISGKSLTYTAEKDGFYYCYITSSAISQVTAVVDGVTRYWDSVNRGYFIDLGWCKSGAQISVNNSGDANMSAILYFFNADNFIAAYNELMKHPLTNIEVVNTLKTTEVRGEVTADRRSTLLFSIPYENGWHATVDGKAASITLMGEALISLDVEAGTHRVVLSYEPEGLLLGAQVTLITVCALLLIAIALLLLRAFLGDKKLSLAGLFGKKEAGSKEEEADDEENLRARLSRIRKRDRVDLDREKRDEIHRSNERAARHDETRRLLEETRALEVQEVLKEEQLAQMYEPLPEEDLTGETLGEPIRQQTPVPEAGVAAGPKVPSAESQPPAATAAPAAGAAGAPEETLSEDSLDELMDGLRKDAGN